MQSKDIFKIIFAIFFSYNIALNAQHVLSHSIENNFADTLLSYIQARYISHITSIPFLYRDFEGSDQLNICYKAEPYNNYIRFYWRRFIINSPQTFSEFLCQIRDVNTPSTLYIVDHIPSDLSLWHSRDIKPSMLFTIPWSDNEFKTLIEVTLSFSGIIPNLSQPDRLNVAIYVGQLYGDNLKNSPLCNPNKVYYKNQIRRVYKFNLNRPILIYLFGEGGGDDFAEELRSEFCDYAITINVFGSHNHILSFFAMQKFDVLIATQSNLAMMTARKAVFDMILYPVHYQQSDGQFWIDCVEVVSNKSDWFPFDVKAIYRDY